MVCIGFLSPFSRSRLIKSLPADYLSVYIKKDLAAINKVFLFCEAFMKLYLSAAEPQHHHILEDSPSDDEVSCPPCAQRTVNHASVTGRCVNDGSAACHDTYMAAYNYDVTGS
jgi:hypothetical protein